jgi:deoxyribonuclease V
MPAARHRRGDARHSARGSSVSVPTPQEVFAGWDGSLAGARALQIELAERVVLRDAFPPLRQIAGVDVGFEDGGAVTRAAVVVVDAATLEPLAEAIARRPTSMPYRPGLLSFRELPAVLAALERLPRTPDLVLVDGQGIAHPRGLGIAAHLGVICDLATIGVAKSRLVGWHGAVGNRRGARRDLHYAGRVIGVVLRSRPYVRPLYVSPGHRVSVASAPELVFRCITRYRLPEPIRLADRLASGRDARGPARRSRSGLVTRRANPETVA